MTTVAGASGFRNAAALAVSQGRPAQSVNLFSGSSNSAQGLLEAGRQALSIPGFGASNTARSLNRQLMSNSADINKMFSLGAATGAATDAEAALIQIRAMRSSTPDSQLSREALRQKYGLDDGGVSEASTGRTVDTEA